MLLSTAGEGERECDELLGKAGERENAGEGESEDGKKGPENCSAQPVVRQSGAKTLFRRITMLNFLTN